MKFKQEKLSRLVTSQLPPNISMTLQTSSQMLMIISISTTLKNTLCLRVKFLFFLSFNIHKVYYPDWLNINATKTAYGVDPSVTFQDCVDQTYTDFYPDIGQSYLG